MARDKSFLNFQVDHMTLLVAPELYPAAYVLFRTVFGVSKADILYEKRRAWNKGGPTVSMTFAVRIGQGTVGGPALQNTLIAVVQPSEPATQPSHVREMLNKHHASAHWQHIALRTSDLLAFHKHASELGVNFITPILKDDDDDLIQVFSGEWYLPGAKPSGLFFEYVQREPTRSLIKRLEEHNRESFFRDKTFLGLYGEKEREYQSGKVTPFIDHALFEELMAGLKGKHVWEITESDLAAAARIMRAYAKAKRVPA